MKDNNHQQQKQNQSNIQFCGFCEHDWKSIIINNIQSSSWIIFITNYIISIFEPLIFLFKYCYHIILTMPTTLNIDINHQYIDLLKQNICNHQLIINNCYNIDIKQNNCCELLFYFNLTTN